MEMHDSHNSWTLQAFRRKGWLFLPIQSIGWRLCVSQMPGSSKVAIFVLTTTDGCHRQTDKTDCLTLAHAYGVIMLNPMILHTSVDN